MDVMEMFCSKKMLYSRNRFSIMSGVETLIYEQADNDPPVLKQTIIDIMTRN